MALENLERLGVNWRGRTRRREVKANTFQGCPLVLVNGNGTTPAIDVFASLRKIDKTCAARAYSRYSGADGVNVHDARGDALDDSFPATGEAAAEVEVMDKCDHASEFFYVQLVLRDVWKVSTARRQSMGGTSVFCFAGCLYMA